MIDIVKIEWLSIEEKEAEVYLSDGKFNIRVFAHPFEIHDRIKLPIYSMNTRNIFISDNIFLLENINNSFEYNVSGCVIDKSNGIIKVGDFLIEIDEPLPEDIEKGNFVSFRCDRLDLW